MMSGLVRLQLPHESTILKDMVITIHGQDKDYPTLSRQFARRGGRMRIVFFTNADPAKGSVKKLWIAVPVKHVSAFHFGHQTLDFLAGGK